MIFEFEKNFFYFFKNFILSINYFFHYSPPEIDIVWPVEYVLSLEIKNKIYFTISFVSAALLIGINLTLFLYFYQFFYAI